MHFPKKQGSKRSSEKVISGSYKKYSMHTTHYVKTIAPPNVRSFLKFLKCSTSNSTKLFLEIWNEIKRNFLHQLVSLLVSLFFVFVYVNVYKNIQHFLRHTNNLKVWDSGFNFQTFVDDYILKFRIQLTEWIANVDKFHSNQIICFF